MDRPNITACILSVCIGVYARVYLLNKPPTQVAEQSGCQSSRYASVICPSASENQKQEASTCTLLYTMLGKDHVNAVSEHTVLTGSIQICPDGTSQYVEAGL